MRLSSRALLPLGVVSLLTYACTDMPVQPAPQRSPIAFPSSSVAAPGGVVIAGAANIARCATQGDETTAALLDSIPGTVVALGDNAFPNGRPQDYQNCYHASWGRHLNRTIAVLGNHDYDSSSTAAGAFGYFGSRLGPLGYYSLELGDWHVVVLNDNGAFVPFAAGSVQDQWLVNDLAVNAGGKCVLAIWHLPLFQSSNSPGFIRNSNRRILWDRLYAAGADVVLNGSPHHYERMAPMRPDATRDDSTGMRQFNVGTGGDALDLPTVAIHPNSEVRGAEHGVLKLTLRRNDYSWQFVPIAGATFSDSGTAPCSGPPPNTPPAASFGAACNQLDCTFTDASTDADGAIASWSWSFGDGATATAQSPSHAYAAAGTYTVTLVVTDNLGASDATSRAVTVNRSPVAAPGGPYRSEADVAFDGGGSSDPDGDAVVAWDWDFGDGASGTGATPAHPYTADGTYTVTLTVTDAKGARSAPVQATATIGNLPPAVNAGPDARSLPGFVGVSATFSDPGANDAPWTYTIDWGDGATTTGTTSSQSGAITASHLYLLPGQYRVRVTVTDKDGGAGSDELIITIAIP